MIKAHSNLSKWSKENEDSFIEAMQSEKKPIYILDSNDCDIDRQLRNYALRHELVEQEIEQRILKEKMSNRENESIDLLVPITLEFSNNEYIILKENINIF